MNQVYRLVWSVVRACWVPAAESARGVRRGSSGRSSRALRRAALAAAALVGSGWMVGAQAQDATLLNLVDSPQQPYTQYTYTFTASLTQTFLTFEFRQDPAYWYLDDVSVTNSGGTQLLTNGGFEGGYYGGQNTPNGWTLIGQAGLSAGGEVYSSSQAWSYGCYDGNYCYIDGAVGGVDGLYQSFATTVGQSYTISFWLANDGGSEAQATVQLGASLDQGGVLVPAPVPSSTDITGSTPVGVSTIGSSTTPVFDGGTLQIDAAGTYTQDFTVNSTGGTIDAAGQDATFSGVMSGAGGLEFTNSSPGGVITLSGINTYIGATTIDQGAIVALSGAGSIASSSGVAVNGTLEVSGASGPVSLSALTGTGTVLLGGNSLTLTAASGDFAGGIGGSGGVEVAGGSQTLSGNNTYTGATSVDAGATLALSGAGSIASSSNVDVAGTLDVSGASGAAALSSLSGSGTVALGANDVVLTAASGTFSGAIGGTGGVDVTGGSQTLSGVNTYSGATSVGSGATLALSGAGSIASSSGVSVDGTLDISAASAPAAVSTLSGSGTVALGGNDLVLTAAAGTFSGAINGTGGVAIAGGTETLTGTSGYSGGTLVTGGGRVVVNGDSALGATSGVLTLDNGTLETTGSSSSARNVLLTNAATIDTDAGVTTVLSGTVDGSSLGDCFIKSGTGTLSLAGSATMALGTCVQQGRLNANGVLNSFVYVDPAGLLRGTGEIAGPVSVYGTLAPGNSPGTLSVTNTVTMQAGSTYQEDINGTGTAYGPGNYSRLLVSGAQSQFIATGSTLVVNLQHVTGAVTYTPYTPVIGNSFDIVSAQGGIVGRFADFTQPDGLAAGTRLAIFYDVGGDNSIVLRVVPISYGAYVGLHGGNANTVSAGNAIDQVMNADQAGTASARQDQFAYAVSGLSASQLPSTVAQLDGPVHAALAAVAPESANWLQGAVVRQLQGANEQGAADPGHAFWFDATADHARWSSDATADGFSSNRTQFAVGLDLAHGPSRAGIGFTHALTDVSDDSASGSIEQNLGFVYGQYALSQLRFDGLAGYGHSHWDTSRADPLQQSGTLTTHVHGDSSLASAGVRWPLHLGGWRVEPYARELWQRNARASFNEGSAVDALQASSARFDGLRSMLGVSAGSAAESPLAAPFTYRVDLAVGHDNAGETSPTLVASLAGAATTISAPRIGEVFGQLNVQGTARLGGNAYAYLGVSDEARSGKSEDAGVNAGVRLSF